MLLRPISVNFSKGDKLSMQLPTFNFDIPDEKPKETNQGVKEFKKPTKIQNSNNLF